METVTKPMQARLNQAAIEIASLRAQLQTEKVTSAYWKDKYEKANRTDKATKYTGGGWFPDYVKTTGP